MRFQTPANETRYPMPCSCKQLAGADVDLLKELLGVFGEAFGERDTYQGAVPGDVYLRALLTSPDFIVVIAQDADVVIGGLAAYQLRKFERERSEIYIYDLAVAEQHRRKGVATSLINALRRIAKERNVYVIFVQADSEDTPAIRLYESLGAREDVHHFDIPV